MAVLHAYLDDSSDAKRKRYVAVGQGLNQNDRDMSVSGVLLLDDLGSNHRLVTCDKMGYCYFLTQGNLCGSTGSTNTCYPGYSGTSPTPTPGFAYGDQAMASLSPVMSPNAPI